MSPDLKSIIQTASKNVFQNELHTQREELAFIEGAKVAVAERDKELMGRFPTEGYEDVNGIIPPESVRMMVDEYPGDMGEEHMYKLVCELAASHQKMFTMLMARDERIKGLETILKLVASGCTNPAGTADEFLTNGYVPGINNGSTT